MSIVLGASLLSVGVSNAAGTTIKACAKKSGGAMRLIDSTKNCKKSERTLTWGTQGDAGATGAAGSTGGTGATGANGSNGSNGVSSVLTKKTTTSTIVYNSPSAALSAAVPAGKYNFQFSGELNYFNNNTATLKTRYLACLITTNSDGPTALSSAPTYQNMVLWPAAGTNSPFRTSFAPSSASNDLVGTQTYVLSGTLDIESDSSIYLQCKNETLTGDSGSSGQLAKFFYPTFTLVKTNEIVSMN